MNPLSFSDLWNHSLDQAMNTIYINPVIEPFVKSFIDSVLRMVGL